MSKCGALFATNSRSMKAANIKDKNNCAAALFINIYKYHLATPITDIFANS